jgi:hypothetical protein
MKREVTWTVRPVTRYELVRGYIEEDDEGRGNGGSDVLGEYRTEERAQQALEAFKSAEAAARDLQKPQAG